MEHTKQESATDNGSMRQNASQRQGGAGDGDPHAPRRRGVSQELMSVFCGTWNISGHNAGSSPHAPDVPVTGVDRYEWMPGSFFVIGHFEHRFEEGAHEGTSIIGYDPDEQTYFADNFDNLGFHRRYRLVVRDRLWTFTGEFERAKLVFDEDGNEFTQTWEISSDGRDFRPLCELRGSKVP